MITEKRIAFELQLFKNTAENNFWIAIQRREKRNNLNCDSKAREEICFFESQFKKEKTTALDCNSKKRRELFLDCNSDIGKKNGF